MDYPEHEKLMKIQEQSQLIGEFLEWLTTEKEYEICELKEGRFGLTAPIVEDTQELLAQYFSIDLKILEKEKRDMANKQKALINKKEN